MILKGGNDQKDKTEDKGQRKEKKKREDGQPLKKEKRGVRHSKKKKKKRKKPPFFQYPSACCCCYYNCMLLLLLLLLLFFHLPLLLLLRHSTSFFTSTPPSPSFTFPLERWHFQSSGVSSFSAAPRCCSPPRFPDGCCRRHDLPRKTPRQPSLWPQHHWHSDLGTRPPVPPVPPVWYPVSQSPRFPILSLWTRAPWSGNWRVSSHPRFPNC